jgi:hypothetical protein
MEQTASQCEDSQDRKNCKYTSSNSQSLDDRSLELMVSQSKVGILEEISNSGDEAKAQSLMRLWNGKLRGQAR